MPTGRKMEFDPEQGQGTISSEDGNDVFVVYHEDIIDFFAFEKGDLLEFRVTEDSVGQPIAYDVIAARYRLSDIGRVIDDAQLFQYVEDKLNSVVENALAHSPLNATFAKNYGRLKGFQFARGMGSSDFESLRELVVIFPKIDLVESYQNDYDRVRSRLKFQLAMWLGDHRSGRNLLDVVDALMPVIENKVNDKRSWKMYQHLVQTMLAEFKLRAS